MRGRCLRRVVFLSFLSEPQRIASSSIASEFPLVALALLPLRQSRLSMIRSKTASCAP